MAQFLEVKDPRGPVACLNTDHIIAFMSGEEDRAVKVFMRDGRTYLAATTYEGFKKLIRQGGTAVIKHEQQDG